MYCGAWGEETFDVSRGFCWVKYTYIISTYTSNEYIAYTSDNNVKKHYWKLKLQGFFCGW